MNVTMFKQAIFAGLLLLIVLEGRDKSKGVQGSPTISGEQVFL